MSKRTLLLALAAVVAVVDGARPLAQVPSNRLADVRLVSSPVVAVPVPASDAVAAFAVRLILDESGVRYGFEGPAVPDGTPPVDLGTPPDRTVVLTGLTLGTALDEIARANSRVRWTERDGAMLVRLTADGEGLIDRRLTKVAMDHGTPYDVVAAIVHAIDPARPLDNAIVVGSRMNAAATPPSTGRDLTFAFDNPTVLDVLTTASRENGALSWAVTYSKAPAIYENATIRLSESGVNTVTRPIGWSPPVVPRQFIFVTPAPDMPSMLRTYVHMTGVRVSVEALSLSAMAHAPAETPGLDLTDVPPATAIARIVAWDSRYEFSETDNTFHVRPKTLASSSVLDRAVGPFAHESLPLDAILDNLIREFRTPNYTSSRSGAESTGDPSRALTLSLAEPATVRDALEALGRASGESWMVRTIARIDAQNETSIQFFGLAGDGPWRLLPISQVTALPTHPPARPLPDRFKDLAIGPVSVRLDSTNPIAPLAASAETPIGLELLPAAPVDPDPRMITKPVVPLSAGPGNLTDAVYAVAERLGEYDVAADGSVIDVMPPTARLSATHFLDRPIGRFDVRDATTREAVCALRSQMRARPAGVTPSAAVAPCSVPMARTTGPGVRSTAALGALDRRISLTLGNPTPRQVLNAIVGLHNDLTWLVTYESPEPLQAPQMRDEDCVIALGAFFGGPIIPERFYASLDRAPRVSSDGAAAPIGPRLFASPLTLDLPVSWAKVEGALARLTADGERFGVEYMIEPGVAESPASAPPSGRAYSLAGLAVPSALAKIGQFADAGWTQDGDVYHLRQTALEQRADLPIDRVITRVDERFTEPRQVTDYLRKLLQAPRRPGLPIATGATGLVTINQSQANMHAISLAMTNVKVREILDEIVRQLGGAAWFVRYVEANGVCPEYSIELVTPAWRTGVTIPMG